MKPLQIAALLVMSWAGSFGIAFGVQEWRGEDDNDSAALIAQAEACQSAVSWWKTIREDPFFDTRAVAFSEMLLGSLRAMDHQCGQLNPSWEPLEPDAEED